MRIKPGLTHTPEQVSAVDADGNPVRGVNWILTEEEDQQVRDGYRCIKCMEAPLPEAFPAACPVCGYPIRKEQSLEYLRGRQADRDGGPSPEMRRLDEVREREAFRKRAGIWVPGDAI